MSRSLPFRNSDSRQSCLLASVTAVTVLLTVCGCTREVDVVSAPMGTADPHALTQESASSNESTESSTARDSEAAANTNEASTPQDVQSDTGRTIYVMPTGMGQRDGSDWPNAAPASELKELLSEKATAVDQVILGSGTYSGVSVPRGGTADRVLSITGFDTGEGLPTIKGRWKETKPKYHAHSWNAVSLAKGVSHVRISGLQISGFIYGVKATNNRDIEFSGLSITRCREGISLAGLTDSSIRNCRIIGYTKRGIRFKEGCHDLMVEDVVADATGGEDTWRTEAFPFGFAVENGQDNHSIRFERCTARNNLFQGEPGKYWNGDGFVAENKAYDLRYVNCRSFGNSDGGWDDKSRAPHLTGCIAARNKRGFRLWNVRGDLEHPALLENCLGVYNRSAGGSGSSAGLWLCGAVRAERCTFHNNATAAIVIENNGPGGKLQAVDCLLSKHSTTGDRPLVLKEGGTTYDATGVVTWTGSATGEDPRYKADSPEWDGEPFDAFHSRRYGSKKGYWQE